VQNLASFKRSLNFEPPAFENAARYENSECCDDCPMFWLSLVKLGPCSPEKALSVVTQPLKLHTKTCSIVDNSVVDYPILVSFCTEFKRKTPEVL